MTATAAPSTAANWDMTAYFSGLGTEDYRQFWERLSADLRALAERSDTLPPVGPSGAEAWAGFLLEVEDLSQRMHHLGSYLSCLGAADALDDAVHVESGRREALRARLETLLAAVSKRLAEAPEAAFEALAARPELEGAAYWLSRSREHGRRNMPPELEALAAELQVTGLSAWARLYDQLSGKLVFRLRVAGQDVRELPVARTRSLLEDPSAAVRKAALEGSNAAWASIADPLAACLNGISGTRLLLNRRRGGQHYLEPALFDAGIERRTLDTMMEAVTAAQPLVRRYLLTKARLLGRERLGMQDLMAPVTEQGGTHLSWDEGVRLVLGAFGGFHPELAAYARHAVESRWIDHEPRDGKRPGAFCSSSGHIRESRIFLSYDGTPADVLTLAHELGHGFHNWTMRELRHWARGYPMTLAETASTFCEQVVMDALLERAPSREAQLHLLDTRLQDAGVFLLNIPMRFWFECALHDERAEGELSVGRLQELMLEAQSRAYGEAVFPDERDPWFWASKLHFYTAKVTFYNFPYTFGYLFSMGLFARARKEGAEFLDRYRALLRRTGSEPAEEVARQGLGVDLGRPDFWNECIALVEADCRAFEALAG
jgi:oligoendopeptidase F